MKVKVIDSHNIISVGWRKIGEAFGRQQMIGLFKFEILISTPTFSFIIKKKQKSLT